MLRWMFALAVTLAVAGCNSTPSAAPASGLKASTAQDQQDKALATRIAAGMEAMRARDPERARRHLSRALEMAPKSAEAHNAMALLYAYERDDKREEEHYRKALRYNPGFSQGRNNYAALLFRQGRYREAIKQLEKATNDTTYDQRSIAFLNLGRSYAKVGEYDKAAAALERSLRLDSNTTDTYLELADVQFERGRMADARYYLQAYGARARQTPRSLWLGIRIEHALGDNERMAGYELQLESLFKGAPEHVQWKAWKDAGRPSRQEPAQ